MITEWEKRVRIAESKGWVHCSKTMCPNEDDNCPYWWMPGEDRAKRASHTLPDYFKDVTAAYTLLDGLTSDQSYRYGESLAQSVREPENRAFGDKPSKKFSFNGFGYVALAHVSAAQRTQIFGVSMKLWGPND